MSSSLTISFRSPTGSQPKSVTLVVKDYSTDAVIPSAAVTVTGPNGFNFSGTSDANGKIQLGTLYPGQYSLVATATGYQSSASDILANDTFTI